MLNLFLLSLFACAVSTQKCFNVYDEKSVVKHVRCRNLISMVDIANEIQPNWTSIEVVNDSNHTQFSNNAVNVPHLNVIQSLNLRRVGKLLLSDTGFRDYDALAKLDISLSDISVLKSSWFSKKTIEELNVSDNVIKALKKEEMKFLSKMRVFNASHNEIKTVEPNTFLESKKIEVISLSHNRIVNVVFDNLENLKSLYLRGNLIAVIYLASFTRLPRLETLSLADNEITGIVDRSFSSLENLKYLNLSHNKIPYVGPYMFVGASKTKLEEVDLSFNLITIFYPISLHDLTTMTFLDLSNNKLTEIYAQNFIKSTSLLTLYICHNRIAKIAPKSFEKMLMLRTMDISDNKLETFTAEMFGGNLFAGNKLKKLNLSLNLLTTLKASLFALMLNLVTLDLSGNKFQTFPADMLKSNVNMQKLLVDNNQITNLPDGFFNTLTLLQDFSMQNNKVTFLPGMTGPKKLLKLTIGKNPWQCLCLRETIIWARTNRIQLDDFNFNNPFPSCVVIPETTCIKDAVTAESFQIYDKFMDGIAAEDADRKQRLDF